MKDSFLTFFDRLDSKETKIQEEYNKKEIRNKEGQ